MQIKQNCTYAHSPKFGAKFLHSESLKQVADYAVDNRKFDKLNQARKNIEGAYLQTRVRFDMGVNDKGFPFLTFSRFNPKKSVLVPMNADDYQLTKVTIIESSKKCNPLKFAFEKIVKMGNSVPKNNLFKKIVVDK